MLRGLLPKVVRLTPSCSVGCTLLNPAKFFNCNSRHYAKEKLYLSELTEYVNKQIFLMEPKEEREEDISTTPALLKTCNSAQDVLLLIEDMHQTNRLWNDELMLYYQHLNKLLQLSSKEHSIEDIHDIVNDQRFHLLLKKTIGMSAQLNSRHLVYFFHQLIQFKIPSSSFTVKHTIETLKNKINNFFPKDVIICYVALKSCETETSQIKALLTGLLMHLENLAKDEEFFIKSTTDASAELPYSICKAFGNEASPGLKKSLSACVKKSLELRGTIEEKDRLFVTIKALQSLAYIQYPNKDVINVAMKEIKYNSDILTSMQKWTVSQSLVDLNVSFSDDTRWHELLKRDGIHKLNPGHA